MKEKGFNSTTHTVQTPFPLIWKHVQIKKEYIKKRRMKRVILEHVDLFFF